MNSKYVVLAIVVFMLSACAHATLPVKISDQGSDARDSGVIIESGDLNIQFWDAAGGGGLLFNQTYVGAIVNGSWNLILSVELEYGQTYYKDYEVNGVDLDFDGSERLEWFSPLGDIPPQLVQGTAATRDGNESFDNGTLYADDTQNRVGIGTENPLSKLTIGGNIDGVYPTVNGITITDPDSQTTAIWMGNGSNDYLEIVYFPSSRAEIQSYGGTPLALQAAGGRVGIGTDSPEQQLEVEGTNPRIKIDAVSGTAQLNIESGTQPQMTLYQHATTGDLRFYQGADFMTLANGTGRLGIGTTEPEYPLDVEGGALVNGTLYVRDDLNAGVASDLYVYDHEYSQIELCSNYSGSVMLQFSQGNDVGTSNIGNIGYSASTNRFEIFSFSDIMLNSFGNIGVQEPSPQQALHVSDVMMLEPTDSPGPCNSTLEGSLYYDDSMDELCLCNSTAWVSVYDKGAC